MSILNNFETSKMVPYFNIVVICFPYGVGVFSKGFKINVEGFKSLENGVLVIKSSLLNVTGTQNILPSALQMVLGALLSKV